MGQKVFVEALRNKTYNARNILEFRLGKFINDSLIGGFFNSGVDFLRLGRNQRVFSKQFELTSGDLHGLVNNDMDNVFIARRGGRGSVVHKEIGVHFHELVRELFQGEVEKLLL